MRKQIEFRNPSMKQYEKPSRGMLPMFIVIVLLAVGARYLYGANKLPHAELTRWFPAGGSETLLLDCQPETNPAHFFCRVERLRGGDSVASVVIDETTARAALAHFFALWPTQGPSRSSGKGRKSLSWKIADGERVASGESEWRDPVLEKQTSAVLSLEGEIGAQLSR